MQNRIIFMSMATLLSIAALFLPVQIKDYSDYQPGNIFGPTGIEPGEIEYISGMEFEFPMYLVFPLVLLFITLFVGLGKRLVFSIIGLVAGIGAGLFAALVLFATHFTLWASYTTRTGIGFYLVAIGIITCITICIMQIARPKGIAIKRTNDGILDDLLEN